MIHFDGHVIHQIDSNSEKSWSISQFLENYNVLGNEPLEIQNNLFKEVALAAEQQYSTLSETARLRYDFWKLVVLNRITPHIFTYSIQIGTTTYEWELTVNQDGLYYKDISGSYKSPNHIQAQLVSDFWFYGPLLPIPDLDMRKQIVALIRNAFIQVGGSAYKNHFHLFEYPSSVNAKRWDWGDYIIRSFVAIRDYGVEYGDLDFHDGLSLVEFYSFEHCLNCPNFAIRFLGKEIVSEINQRTLQFIALKETSPLTAIPTHSTIYISPSTPTISDNNERSRQLYMDNGGQIHYIYLDGFGDEYNATAAEEAKWKQELIEMYTERLKTETNEAILTGLVHTLHLHQAPHIDAILLIRAQQASLRDQQVIGTALWKGCKSEQGVALLLDFLKANDIESHWHDYVWALLTRIKESQKARSWILECLKSDNVYFFSKAMDILLVWSIGNAGITSLLNSGKLLWENRSQTVSFQNALETLQQVLYNKTSSN